MPDRTKLLADLRAAMSDLVGTAWPDMTQGQAAAIFLAIHGPALIEMVEREGEAASARPKWAECKSRGPWARNSIKHEVGALRKRAADCRKAYKKPYMGEPCEWLAAAYTDAADLLEARLTAIAKAT